MHPRLLVLISLGLTTAACSQDIQPVNVTFSGQVGEQNFACGQTYSLGIKGTQIQPADFRFYVFNIRLVDTTGTELPMTLEQDGLWQYQNLALLDFENKMTPCDDGTTETNFVVHGSASAGSGTYTGIHFQLGVPATLNHSNQAVAPPPLNLSGLFWTWMDGYKFLRTEGATADQSSAFTVHVGSTGCAPDSTGQTQCANLNNAEIELDNFDPQSNEVVADLAALMAGSDLSADALCQSDPTTTVCGPPFQRLGLPFPGTNAATQTFFRVE
jgi:uncharacterized repeat protein (TIGR04052 family)